MPRARARRGKGERGEGERSLVVSKFPLPLCPPVGLENRQVFGGKVDLRGVSGGLVPSPPNAGPLVDPVHPCSFR